MSESNEILHKYVMAPAISGMVGTGLFMLVYGNTGKLMVGPMKMSMSPAFAFGTSIAVADVVSSVVSDSISESTSIAQLDTAQKMLIKPTLTGLSTVGMVTALIAAPKNVAGAAQVFMLGAGSSIGGQYTNTLLMGIV
jgi:hypothetical protein